MQHRHFHKSIKSAALTVVAYGALFAAGTAAAMPLLITNGSSEVTGIGGLDIGGTLYDVTFSDGDISYDAALVEFGSVIEFTTEAAAIAASDAIMAFLNSQGTDAEAEDMFWGGANSIDHDILVTFEVDAVNVTGVAAGDWDQGSLTWGPTSIFVPFTRDDTNTTGSGIYSWAIFSDAAVSVPEPASAALLGLGLAGLGLARRRRACS